jgi:hypothetical protein
MINRAYKTAAWLMIAAGLLNLVWGVVAFTGQVDVKDAVRYVWIISPLPYFGFATAFTNRILVSDVLMGIYLAGIPMSILGGFVSGFRKAAVPWFVGTLGALVCCPIVGVVSVVFSVRSAKSGG